uniref:Uncharacterized protein n=1 Tax=Arundo donax TaxID=35708 RepID=A0A0A9GK03_ARUDO
MIAVCFALHFALLIITFELTLNTYQYGTISMNKDDNIA